VTSDFSGLAPPRFIEAPVADLAPGAVSDWRSWGRTSLAPCSESPQADTDLLLAHVLGCERKTLMLRDTQSLSASEALRLVGLVERRKLGEPIAYLTGRRGFWSLELVVDARVLVPRPDTETLVEGALEHLKRSGTAPRRTVDLGTGSGAVALSLAREFPQLPFIATDASEAALDVARDNATALGIANVEFRLGDWFGCLAGESFDLIVSNPPYLAVDDRHLEALRFEPRAALVSGADGLEALRHIIFGAPRHLRPQGVLMVEHGASQALAVCALLEEAGFSAVATRADLAGLPRVSGGTWRA